MRTLYILLFLSVPMFSELKSQNVVTDDFIYAPADSIEGLGNWYRSGLNTAFNIKVAAPGLVYAGYSGSALGNSCQITNAGNGDIVYTNFSAPIVSGAAYLSLMVRVDALPSSVTEGFFISFNPNTGGTNLNTALHIKRLTATTFNLGVRKQNPQTYSNSVFDVGKTYLVVLKYSIIAGMSNDSSSLYVFENGVPAQEPATPTAGTTSGNDYTGQASVYLNNNYAQDGLLGCDIKVDGIRVGNSWATSILSNPISAVSEYSESKILARNFPNPFQSETTIKYQLPERGLVSIDIYDASGLHCAALLHDYQEGGEHEAIWNADKFPAGMYTCKVQFKGAVISNKLLRIK